MKQNPSVNIYVCSQSEGTNDVMREVTNWTCVYVLCPLGCEEDPCPERRWRDVEGGRGLLHRLMGETHKATNLQRLSLIVTVEEVACY